MKNDMMAFRPYCHLRDFLLILLSSLFLVLSFPNFNIGILAWVGLLPLFIAINGKRSGSSFFLSLICGMFFFWGIFRWIVGVPKQMFLHHTSLLIYLGSYFGFFGLTFNLIRNRAGMTAAFFAAPFLWVSLEYVRSNFSFLALPLALLAHSQHQYPVVLQVASLAGTYSISFLIVMVNCALAAIVYPLLFQPRHNSSSKESGRSKIALASVSSGLLLFVIIYGSVVISQPVTGSELQISLVQGNIKQAKKWDPKYAQEIMDIYTNLTLETLKDRPGLIIWPETATPGSISLNSTPNNNVRNLAKVARAYLLVGSAQQQKLLGKGSVELKYSNSAYLIPPNPEIGRNQHYDKIHLFPFGEYLPYKEVIPWSFIGVSESANYLSGKEFTVFELPSFRFGVTICWENVFPDLFRQFVKRGAQFMVNITNEARFGKTIAPYQLASISVFRAVENRIFVIRCANTGISCIIDPYGHIVDRVKDGNGEDICVRGVVNGRIALLNSKTIYTRYGDWIVWIAMTMSVVFLVSAIFKRSPQKPTR